MREEVRFVSGDGECAGTLYRPAAASVGRTPCVVMVQAGDAVFDLVVVKPGEKRTGVRVRVTTHQ